MNGHPLPISIPLPNPDPKRNLKLKKKNFQIGQRKYRRWWEWWDAVGWMLLSAVASVWVLRSVLASEEGLGPLDDIGDAWFEPPPLTLSSAHWVYGQVVVERVPDRICILANATFSSSHLSVWIPHHKDFLIQSSRAGVAEEVHQECCSVG